MANTEESSLSVPGVSRECRCDFSSCPSPGPGTAHWQLVSERDHGSGSWSSCDPGLDRWKRLLEISLRKQLSQKPPESLRACSADGCARRSAPASGALGLGPRASDRCRIFLPWLRPFGCRHPSFFLLFVGLSAFLRFVAKRAWACTVSCEGLPAL